jgi:hypothetical protein
MPDNTFSNQYEIQYIEPSLLKIPDWKATHILRPDLLVLAGSLIEFGFISPIHVQASTMEIIDGSERFSLASEFPAEILANTNGLIPVIMHDVDLVDAMLMHIRLNRGRASLVSSRVSTLLRTVRRSNKYANYYLQKILSMGSEEMFMMLDGSLVKVRKLKEHSYARAWVPIEAPSGKTEQPIVIEKPPNPDR